MGGDKKKIKRKGRRQEGLPTRPLWTPSLPCPVCKEEKKAKGKKSGEIMWAVSCLVREVGGERDMGCGRGKLTVPFLFN